MTQLTTTPTKYVYAFDEGDAEMKDLLGGKGANLAEMTRIGLPVPPGFVITTVACQAYLETGVEPHGVETEIRSHLAALEQRAGRTLGARTTRCWCRSGPGRSSRCPA